MIVVLEAAARRKSRRITWFLFEVTKWAGVKYIINELSWKSYRLRNDKKYLLSALYVFLFAVKILTRIMAFFGGLDDRISLLLNVTIFDICRSSRQIQWWYPVEIASSKNESAKLKIYAWTTIYPLCGRVFKIINDF